MQCHSTEMQMAICFIRNMLFLSAAPLSVESEISLGNGFSLSSVGGLYLTVALRNLVVSLYLTLHCLDTVSSFKYHLTLVRFESKALHSSVRAFKCILLGEMKRSLFSLGLKLLLSSLTGANKVFQPLAKTAVACM